MRISVIAAIDRNGLIGGERGLPWRLPRDLQRFKALTLGKPVVMGRTTREHIGRPLPGRHNIVLSRSPGLSCPGCTVAHSLDEALRAAGDGVEEVLIIGGATVYREALPRADRIYLTVVDGLFSGQTYFPGELIRPREWAVVRRELCEADDKNPHRHLFLVLERNVSGGTVQPAFDLATTLKEPFATGE